MNDLIISLNEKALELKAEIGSLKKQIADLENTCQFQDEVINRMSDRIYRSNLDRLTSKPL